MTPIERLRSPHYVYRLYDADMRLLYVGCTYNPHKRLMEHRRERPWFPTIVTVRVTAYADALEGLAAEAEAHASESPLHGAGHNALGWATALLADVEKLAAA